MSNLTLFIQKPQNTLRGYDLHGAVNLIARHPKHKVKFDLFPIHVFEVFWTQLRINSESENDV